MAVHHGGKVGKAGKTLASRSSCKSAKSKAGETLTNHKAKQVNPYAGIDVKRKIGIVFGIRTRQKGNCFSFRNIKTTRHGLYSWTMNSELKLLCPLL